MVFCYLRYAVVYNLQPCLHGDRAVVAGDEIDVATIIPE